MASIGMVNNTRQYSLSSYCTDLGLTVSVACRTIHWVCLVVQYSQVHQKQHYVLCPLLPWYCVFFISQICFWDHKYVFHLGKVFYHLVEVIFNLFASMVLTLCPNLSNFRTSSHVPREMSHMASLVYSKIWDFCIFFSCCTVFFSSS
jgi:hypothetical protein